MAKLILVLVLAAFTPRGGEIAYKTSDDLATMFLKYRQADTQAVGPSEANQIRLVRLAAFLAVSSYLFRHLDHDEQVVCEKMADEIYEKLNEPKDSAKSKRVETPEASKAPGSL